jgi:prolyl-tRNA editing enzyme YbaK/EbsC (Cys-tRNA(Pro) deacylase)
MAGAIDRFRAAAEALGLQADVHRFPEGTKTAVDAARAIGCDVAQIVKSMVFVADGAPLVALTSGANRADPARLAGLIGAADVRRADAEEARAATGFGIGGTPPFGYPGLLPMFLDEDLMAFQVVWAACGTPDSVFPIEPGKLLDVTGAAVAAFRQE